MSRRIHVLVLAAGFAVVGATARAGEPDASSPTFFELKVRPLLASSCVKCHGEKKRSGGLRLDSREAILAGGENGAVIVPGDPQASPLIRAIRHADEALKMPPNKPLPSCTPRRILTAWVAAGLRTGRPRSRTGRSRGRNTGRSTRSGRSHPQTIPPAGRRSRSTGLLPPGSERRGFTPSSAPIDAPSSVGRILT